MQRASINFGIVVMLLGWFLSWPLNAQEKLAQTGLQFLSVGTDARATAMGEALTTFEGTAVSLFYNPAGMARLPKLVDLRVSRMTWIADINYVSAAMAFSFAEGRYGVFGISVLSVDYGDFIGTVVADNERGFIETGSFSPSAYVIGVGYAKDLTDRFSVGGQIKLVAQSLGKPYVPVSDSLQVQKSFSQSVYAFDFGTLYKTGFKSLRFGMSVRNFSRELKYAQEGFQLPLTFKIGFSMDVMDFWGNRPENQSLWVFIDTINRRSFREFVTIGGEYRFMDKFYLRAGYVSLQDVYDFTYGFGLNGFGIAIDYSYTPMSVFTDVHRVSFGFAF